MSRLVPHLEILSPEQKRLWPELAATPPAFTLYGGTALALRLGHRTSIDFDFFARESFDPEVLYRRIPYLAGATVRQREENTLTCEVDCGGKVKVSYFGLRDLMILKAPDRVEGPGFKVASLTDLAGMKASVVQMRAEAKDYLDLDALLTHGVGLPIALAAGQVIYGKGFNPQSTLKALSYFGDGDLPGLPQPVKDRLIAAVQAVDLDRLPRLRGRSPADRGISR